MNQYYFTLECQPWAERAKIIVFDFLRTLGKKPRGVTSLRSNQGLFAAQFRLSAGTRRELDQAIIDMFRDYPTFGYETKIIRAPRFYRGVWTATIYKTNKC